MNVLIEMTTLSTRRPAADAPREVTAAWYEAKARLHAYLASEGGPDTELELTLARAAYGRARALLRHGVSTPA